MIMPAHAEALGMKGAGMNRSIHKLIEVLGQIHRADRIVRKGNRHRPVLWHGNLKAVLIPTFALNQHHHCGEAE